MDTVTEATEESIHDDDSVTDVHVVKGWGGDLYTADQINVFLDETKGKKALNTLIVPVMKAAWESFPSRKGLDSKNI